MKVNSEHTFHIPVMGLAYTIDTPIKIARFGITSVVSIIQDHLIEQMRAFYANKFSKAFVPIPSGEYDYRAKRITAYLNLMQDLIDEQVEIMKLESFEEESDLVKYFELLPDGCQLKMLYESMKDAEGSERIQLQNELKSKVVAGDIDVNIMTKLDKLNKSADEELLPVEFADAMAALRGYANSKLSSSVVFSAGLNPRLFAYVEKFPDFFPDENGFIKKKIILKVSDYRSAMIQGKFLAKKGIWVSEFRVESGLNCGGHAFPTEGKLLGPILEEFKLNRGDLNQELFKMCDEVHVEQNRLRLKPGTEFRLTFQGGLGTHEEDTFLRHHYDLDGTGWGSPFLLVPEATSVDDKTLYDLANANKEDYFLSYASPLGIPFNNFKKSTSEVQRIKRIDKNRPGSPCYLKYLAFNNEYDPEKSICIASREFQNLKLKELKNSNLTEEQLALETEKIVEKDCLCEGLSTAVLLKNKLPIPHKLEAVNICPGPNLAYFSKVFSLEQMVGHIYGRFNVLNNLNRPHVFINELKMYVDYAGEEFRRNAFRMTEKQVKYFDGFKANLLSGIEYYKSLFQEIKLESLDPNISWKFEIDSILTLIDDVFESAKMSAVVQVKE